MLKPPPAVDKAFFKTNPRSRKNKINLRNVPILAVLDKQHGIDASVVFAIVRDLRPAAPDDFATGGDETELGDVYFDDCAAG